VKKPEGGDQKRKRAGKKFRILYRKKELGKKIFLGELQIGGKGHRRSGS